MPSSATSPRAALALHAASLVYTTMLSLVPLAALGFSVLKGFGVHYRFEPLLATMLAPLGDQAPEISERLMDFVENVNVGVLGAVGLALLFYTAISTVQKVESAFNDIWHVHETRSIARKFTDYLSVLLIGPVLMFSAVGLAGTVIASEPIRQLGQVSACGCAAGYRRPAAAGRAGGVRLYLSLQVPDIYPR